MGYGDGTILINDRVKNTTCKKNLKVATLITQRWNKLNYFSIISKVKLLFFLNNIITWTKLTLIKSQTLFQKVSI